MVHPTDTSLSPLLAAVESSPTRRISSAMNRFMQMFALTSLEPRFRTSGIPMSAATEMARATRDIEHPTIVIHSVTSQLN